MIVKNHAELALLAQVRAGNDSAFAELDLRYEPLKKLCVASALRKNPAADSEEMLQEARYALYRAALSYDGDRGYATFGLYAKICIEHRLIDRFLKLKMPPTCSLEQLQEDGHWEPADPPNADALSDMIEQEALEALLGRMRATLSPFEMQVCELRAMAMSAEEIASRLGSTRKSVENALYRASRKMR